MKKTKLKKLISYTLLTSTILTLTALPIKADAIDNIQNHLNSNDNKIYEKITAKYTKQSSDINEIKNYINILHSNNNNLKTLIKDSKGSLEEESQNLNELKEKISNIKTDIKNLNNNEKYEIVNIPDEKLRKIINYTLGKNRNANQKITKIEMESIKEINGDEILEYLPMDKWVAFNTPCRGLKSLEGLQYAINLEKLDLSENGISDLNPLKNLKKLRYVELDRNMIKDLTPLSNLKNLEHLNIYNNEGIVDMKPISNLYKLEWLDLHFCNRGKQKVNVEPLGNLKNLKMVNLESNLVEDISFAKKLKNIEIIGVGANHITDMTPLQNIIHKTYGNGVYVDETKNYVGMLVESLKNPINIKAEYKTNTYKIPDMVKGLDEYIKAYNITPKVVFLNGQENEDISLNYNEKKREIEVKVKGNVTEKERTIKTTIILGYEKYTLNIDLNIKQKVAPNKEARSMEAEKIVLKSIGNLSNFKVNEENLDEAENILNIVEKDLEIAKNLNKEFDRNSLKIKKVNDFKNKIKTIKIKKSEKKLPETIKAVDDAFMLRNTLNKNNLEKAKGMLSFARYKIRKIKDLNPNFDDANLNRKLDELEKIIKHFKK